MDNPVVTFLLVCYNHQAYVAEAIRSVLLQTYPNIQLVVVDDHSTDNSHAIITALQTENNFTYIRNEQNEGLNNSILIGLKASIGEYISFLASDDFVTSDKIAMQMDYLRSNGKKGVYSTGYTYEDGKAEIIKISDVFHYDDKQKILDYLYRFDWGVPLQQSSLLHKDIMLGLTDLRKEFKSDDWAFIIKVYEKYDVGYLDHPVFYYRLHGTNTHKKYWFTFPMRIDIASRLVPENYRMKTLSNIFYSHAQYLLWDKKNAGIRFFICSMILDFSFKNGLKMLRTFGALIKYSLFKRKHKG